MYVYGISLGRAACSGGLGVLGGTRWPAMSFQSASSCLLGHSMRDKEGLRNRGDVKELGVTFC